MKYVPGSASSSPLGGGFFLKNCFENLSNALVSGGILFVSTLIWLYIYNALLANCHPPNTENSAVPVTSFVFCFVYNTKGTISIIPSSAPQIFTTALCLDSKIPARANIG